MAYEPQDSDFKAISKGAKESDAFRKMAGTDAESPVQVATSFVAAWATTTGGEAAWMAGMRPWASTTLMSSLTGTDPTQVPASRVTP
jgi:hypothetical protein